MIAAEKTNFPVAVMCRVLGVSRTGFHNWERRAPSDRALTDAWLTEKIKQIHERQPGRVRGAQDPRRAAHGARRPGRAQAGRAVDESRRYRGRQAPEAVEDDDPDPGDHPGHRPGRAAVHGPTQPNVLWVADITYLRTGEGWLYLAAVQDAYSRPIVGWSMATHMRATLVVDALKMALARRRPEPGLIHHSDQGGQYVVLAFGRAAREAGIAVSMGSRGDAYDNAVAETFFATLKKELVNRRTLAVAARAAVRRVRIHRGVLQPPAPPLHPRHALPGRLRTTTTLAARWLRSITRTTTININNTTPGVTQTGAGPPCPATLSLRGTSASRRKRRPACFEASRRGGQSMGKQQWQDASPTRRPIVLVSVRCRADRRTRAANRQSRRRIARDSRTALIRFAGSCTYELLWRTSAFVGAAQRSTWKRVMIVLLLALALLATATSL